MTAYPKHPGFAERSQELTPGYQRAPRVVPPAAGARPAGSVAASEGSTDAPATGRAGRAGHGRGRGGMTGYFDLGSHHRPMPASSPDAQLWFDRGLIWAYAFNHEEAVRCFERPSRPTPAAPWPTGGWPTRPARTTTRRGTPSTPPIWPRRWPALTAAERALACAGRRAGPAEQALIAAIAARYPALAPPVDGPAWNESYARAMRQAYLDHPGDLDIAALFADALMNVTPWQLWDLPSAGPRPARTPRRRGGCWSWRWSGRRARRIQACCTCTST